MRFSRCLPAAAALAGLACGPGPRNGVRVEPTLAARIERLSEPGGYFDTDNLISNERSYLHVMGDLEELAVRGGAYIGVGPDQNFAYIAAIRPDIAFIIDIRRDNLLLHLLFKSLFALAPTRAEYLALLHGRRPPPPGTAWEDATVEQLVAYVDGTAPDDRAVAATRARVDSVLGRLGIPLAEGDLTTIRRFHRAFIDDGLSLKFRSAGRAPRFYYPTYRDLLLETDRSGRHAGFLASEEGYRFLRGLQARDLVIPVIGDLAGPRALRAIGALLAERGERVSAFYTSNVEYYLFREGSFPRFAANVAHLPHGAGSVIIRSVFPATLGFAPPEMVPGYYSAQLVQPIDELLAGAGGGRYRSYGDLVAAPAVVR